MKYWKS